MELQSDFPTLPKFLKNNDFQTFGITPSAKLGTHTDLSSGFLDYLEQYRHPRFPETLSEFFHIYLSNLVPWVRLGYNHLRYDGGLHEFQASVLKDKIRKYNPDHNPFFGFTNFLCAHNPYNPPKNFKKEFERPKDGVDREKVKYLSENGLYQYLSGEISVKRDEWELLKDWYDGAIARADARVGEALNTLKGTGAYDNTMIIITADHGEHFGEKSRVYHHFSVYEELIHVPLIIKFPNQRFAGTTINNLVSLTDIYPTIHSLISSNESFDFDGMSLPPIGDEYRDAIFAEYGEPVTAMNLVKKYSDCPVPREVFEDIYHGFQCCRTETEKYIRIVDGEDELYNIDTDPEESKNLLEENSIEGQSAQHLRRLVHNKLSDLPEMTADMGVDQDVRENLEELGYL
jgi:arylsulfatase A-like enzyme